MLFLKHSFAVIPTIGFADRLIRRFGAFAGCDPVDSRQKFHAEWCFKAGNEIDCPLKVFSGGRMIFKKTFCLRKNLEKQIDLPLRIVLCVTVPGYEVSFHKGQHMAQVLCVWSIKCLIVLKLQILSRLLHKYINLWISRSVTKGSMTAAR